MRRLLLLILLVMSVVWFSFFAAHRLVSPHKGPGFGPLDERLRSVDRAHRVAHRAALEARDEARQAGAEAQVEVREALHEANQEVREALEEAAEEVRVAVDGIPVPIVPGTRVVEAVPQPPAACDLPADSLAEAPRQPPAPPSAPALPTPPGFPGMAKHPDAAAPSASALPRQKPLSAASPKEIRVVTGLISATEERAREEARSQLEREVTNWLEAEGVPRSWRPSPRQLDAMILETKIEPVIKDYGTLYLAKIRVDVSPERRAGFAETYQRQLVHRRMVLLGGALGFVLICLGAISGYIRADEATKGYYTNRLRLLAAVGVGAAGVVIYKMLA